jgi:ABC-type sugar transport system ATPase subunit
MEYAHVKRYSEAYGLQAQFNSLQEQALTAYLTVQSNIIAGNDPHQLSQADSQRAKVAVQEALARIVAVQQIGTALKTMYQKVLKPE